MSQDASTDQRAQKDQAIHLATVYCNTGNYERARDVLRSVLAENPSDPALLAHHARAEYMLDNFEGAAWSAYAALSAGPEDEFAMRMYALSLDGLGRDYEALWMAWRTLLAHPNEPVIHRAYARLLRKGRQTASALYSADQALRLDPANPDGLVLRGAILHDLGRFPESDAMYQQALALDPANAEALNCLAINRLHRGRFAPALRGFLGAARSDPTMGTIVRGNIGVALEKILRWVTVIGTVVAVFSLSIIVMRQTYGHSPGFLRILTGSLLAALIGVFVWLLRAIPRRVLTSVLREQGFVVARVVHAVLALVVGACVTISGGPVGIIPVACFLVVSGVILVRVGLNI
jgi:Flp pilus assembly protein TadD